MAPGTKTKHENRLCLDSSLRAKRSNLLDGIDIALSLTFLAITKNRGLLESSEVFERIQEGKMSPVTKADGKNQGRKHDEKKISTCHDDFHLNCSMRDI
jgi:hypothetical protein